MKGRYIRETARHATVGKFVLLLCWVFVIAFFGSLTLFGVAYVVIDPLVGGLLLLGLLMLIQYPLMRLLLRKREPYTCRPTDQGAPE